MADLASLTDSSQPQPTAAQAPIVGNNDNTGMAERIYNRLLGLNGEERYQTWPEKLIKDALTPSPEWSVDQTTGDVHTSPQMIKQGVAASALGGTGGLAGVGEGADAALGSAPFLRPALKYQGKIYKAPGRIDETNIGTDNVPGHSDAIPDTLYPEFQKQAMSGQDISNFNFGYMNHKGQFISREDALKYAIDNGMVDPQAAKYGTLTSTMFSNPGVAGIPIENKFQEQK